MKKKNLKNNKNVITRILISYPIEISKLIHLYTLRLEKMPQLSVIILSDPNIIP